MDKQDSGAQNSQISTDVQVFELMQKTCHFEITPCDKSPNLDHYTKLEITSAQKIQVSALMQQIPQTIAAGTMAQAYIAKFPEGLPHTLITLRQGGFGGMIRADNGQFVGAASFYSLSTQAALMGAFTAMSAVTGQYFLTEINSQLTQLNKKIDAILEFLSESKKAELLSEISFVQRSNKNYGSIMKHEEQRCATIGSLQQSQKIAMQDVEFYLKDFEKKLEGLSDEKKLYHQAEELLKAKECLELSLQLYIISSISEAYYAQNFDSDYIALLKNSICNYTKMCKTRLSKSFHKLEGKLDKKDGSWLPKAMAWLKTDKSPEAPKVSDLLDFAEILEEEDRWPIAKKEINFALDAPTQADTYIFTDTGDIYLENPQ